MRSVLRRVRLPMWCFLAILWVVSAFDYADHLGRPGSPFVEYWGAWLAFTVASTTGVCAVLLGVHLVGPRDGWRRIAIDAIGAFVAPAVHVWLTGPLANRVFYSHADLHFHSPWGLSGVMVTGLLVVWTGYLLARRMIRIGRPAPDSRGRIGSGSGVCL